jgi:tetratricopeptide (TPR) repeat protein
MQPDALAHQVLAAPNLPALVMPWPDHVADAVVEHLKNDADRHWGINAHRSLELANTIVAIGRARQHAAYRALGIMARGDALKFLGHLTHAWAAFDEAGRLFQAIGDDVGWARTRIGRLLLCVDLNRVDEALADAEQARQIFTTHSAWEKQLRLDHDTAYVYTLLGDHQRALSLYQLALQTALAFGQVGETYLGTLYFNVGVIYDALGDLDQALRYLQQAHARFTAANITRNAVMADVAIARIAMTQGNYRRALQLLLRAREVYASEALEHDKTEVDRLLARCYRLLNRHHDAHDLLHDVVHAYHTSGAAYEEALAYEQLAVAEAELGRFDAARAALDAAQPIFQALGAKSWDATIRLRRGRIALQQGDHELAAGEAAAAAHAFKQTGQQMLYAQATLLEGQVALTHGDLQRAAHAGRTALGVAQQCNVPGLRYTAHLLLGRVAEAQHDPTHALRRYRAAAATVERMQRGLTITLRPGFLEDKGEALRALIAMHLRNERTQQAFGALERAKGQVLLGYLAHRDQLRWPADDPRSQVLIRELTQLRRQHHQLYAAAHGSSGDDTQCSSDVQDALATCERRMRTITEQLYLHEGDVARRTAVPGIRDLQQHLDDAALVEYYNDGTQLWAFVLDGCTLTQHRLPCTVAQLAQLLAQLQINIAGALRLDPHATSTRVLTVLAQRILQRLHTVLLAPLRDRLHHGKRLVVVPYGALHYLPFHLLHNGDGYLLEQREVVILPAASLLGQRGPHRARGALVLAHSANGRLPQTRVLAHLW